MVLRVYAKFHDQNISGSRDMGSKVVKNGVFRIFVENDPSDLVHFPTDGSYNNITCVCKISSLGNFSFSRYGDKSGQNEVFWDFVPKDTNNLVHSPT